MSQDINTIIEQLAEIDSASAKIMQKAQLEKSQYADYITEQKKLFDSSLQKEIDREVDELQDSIKVQNQKLITQSQTDCDKDIAALDKAFEQNGEQWADEIFNRIIKE